MEQSDINLLSIPNREAALKMIEVDDAYEAQSGESLLGPTKPFLQEVLEDTKDSIIPNAFSALLNKRLTGQLRALPPEQKQK